MSTPGESTRVSLERGIVERGSGVTLRVVQSVWDSRPPDGLGGPVTRVDTAGSHAELVEVGLGHQNRSGLVGSSDH